MEIIEKIIDKNGLVFAFLFVGLIMFISFWISKNITRKKIPGVAIAIIAGLGLAFLGDRKGIADIPIFAGMALLGGSMLRDFSVVATAMGADLNKHRFSCQTKRLIFFKLFQHNYHQNSNLHFPILISISIVRVVS